MIVLNVLWVADSVWVALGGMGMPSALGQAFVAAQALAVVVFAELEFIGMRRAPLVPA